MRTLKTLIVASTLLGLWISGCATPIVRNIRAEAYVEPSPPAVARPCSIDIAPLVDLRPEEETTKPNQVKPHHFVPAILWWQWGNAGPMFAKPEYYDHDLLTSMRALMETTLDESGVFAAQGPKYVLKARLHHYYGVGYQKEMAIVSAGAAMADHYFFPTGHVGMELTLVEESSGREVATRYVSEAFLFAPDILGADTRHTAYGMSSNSLTDNRTLMATVALRRLMLRLPLIVDQMVAQEPAAALPMAMSPSQFVVERVTDEYDFVERMTIEYATGRVLRDEITRRKAPLVSKAGEWVVSPVAESGHWMSQQQYDDLLEVLARRYKVEIDDNLSAARFSGQRDDPVEPVEEAPAEGEEGKEPTGETRETIDVERPGGSE